MAPSRRAAAGDEAAAIGAGEPGLLNGHAAPDGKPCRALRALRDADQHLVAADADPLVREAAVIGAVQRVVHYKIAACSCVRA